MNWNSAYIQMKENNAFVRRKSWGAKYFMWLKPAVEVRLEWCKDKQLIKVIEKFGGKTEDGSKIIKAEDVFCLFNGYAVETGFDLRREDRYAEDWEVIEI